MRSIALATLLVLLACNDRGKAGDPACVHDGTTYAIGDVFPAGDGCNSCMCTADGAACTELACGDGGVDADPTSCTPSGGCPAGPACGIRCCGAGERCANGVCQCGSQAACGIGDTCQAAGPAGGDGCGTVCCGASGPCPLGPGEAPAAAAAAPGFEGGDAR